MQQANQVRQWFGLAAACVLACATAPAQTTYYVATHGNDGTGDGTSANPWLTISNGVRWASSVAGNIVLVSNGTYDISARITITNGLQVLGLDGNGASGSGNPGDVVVKGTDTMSQGCFYINDTNSLLAGFTITNGLSAGDYAGGVVVYYGTMSNCMVAGCTAGSGGGVYIYHGTVVTSTIAGNCATSTASGGGGGVYFRTTTSTGRLIASRVVGNTSAYRGGAVNFGGSGGWMISNCVLVGNSSVDDGGGIYGGDCLIVDTQIISNRSLSTAAYQGGGGVRVSGGPAVIERCRIEYNESNGSWGGGGIVVRSGWLTLRNSTLAGNIATNVSGWGGGIYSAPDPIASYYGTIIDGCVISSNISLQGGGVFAQSRTIISNSIISANTALNNVGGIRFNDTGSSQQVWNCIIQGNVGNRPGGLYILGNNPGFYGCLIAGNCSTNSNGYAGGIYITNGVVENCTIVSNQASGTGEGGGIYCGKGVKIRNAIIYANSTGTASSSNWYNEGSGMTYTNCCTMPTNNLAGTGNISANPLCISLAGGNYRLARGSPCVNAGINQAWMTNYVDLDSRARVRYGTVDMGAYEHMYDATLYRSW